MGHACPSWQPPSCNARRSGLLSCWAPLAAGAGAGAAGRIGARRRRRRRPPCLHLHQLLWLALHLSDLGSQVGSCKGQRVTRATPVTGSRGEAGEQRPRLGHAGARIRPGALVGRCCLAAPPPRCALTAHHRVPRGVCAPPNEAQLLRLHHRVGPEEHALCGSAAGQRRAQTNARRGVAARARLSAWRSDARSHFPASPARARAPQSRSHLVAGPCGDLVQQPRGVQ